MSQYLKIYRYAGIASISLSLGLLIWHLVVSPRDTWWVINSLPAIIFFYPVIAIGFGIYGYSSNSQERFSWALSWTLISFVAMIITLVVTMILGVVVEAIGLQ